MKWKKNKITENLGVNFVAKNVNEAGCIFNKIDGSNDVGLDGYIEFVENEDVTGLCIGVQIKAGDSNLSKDGTRVYLKSDREHFEYWTGHTLPVIGVVYIPTEDKGYWVDLTGYIQNKRRELEDGSYNIPVSRTNEFSSTTFEGIYLHFKKYIGEFSQFWNFGKSLSLFVDEHQVEDRFDALKSLFYYHRNKKETWFYLIRQFGIERNPIIQRNLLIMFTYLIGHGDVHWHKDNIMDESIRTYGKDLIKKLFGVSELKILLKNIDEDGIGRGAIGQSIHVLIDVLPFKIEYLKKIILDEETDDESRSYAGMIIIYELQWYDLERALNFAHSMIINFPRSAYKETFEVMKQVLSEERFVDFY